ncbi:hypothetical protein BT93_L0664 [Corymbia citriodora subsp. variegata]|uniref:Uncharacterized protein n=1 Tax=Corymbia citriodora subsp. variegata TaxID=360336 RepID=A0A8T0CIL5_CORYI|nr:hypothetical protein BT93_L0664 [Corymbia citriodora subsp. variegata]
MADETQSIRYTQLQKVFASALRATLAANSHKNFAICFPTPAAYCPQALEGVWQQLNSRLEEECLRDFEKICEERHVASGLHSLETIVEQARARKEVAEESGQADSTQAMHSLSANELYNAHVADGMLQAEREIKDKLTSVQDANRQQWEVVQRQRIEIEKLVAQIEASTADVEAASALLARHDMKADIEQELERPPTMDVQ